MNRNVSMLYSVIKRLVCRFIRTGQRPSWASLHANLAVYLHHITNINTNCLVIYPSLAHTTSGTLSSQFTAARMQRKTKNIFLTFSESVLTAAMFSELHCDVTTYKLCLSSGAATSEHQDLKISTQNLRKSKKRTETNFWKFEKIIRKN